MPRPPVRTTGAAPLAGKATKQRQPTGGTGRWRAPKTEEPQRHLRLASARRSTATTERAAVEVEGVTVWIFRKTGCGATGRQSTTASLRAGGGGGRCKAWSRRAGRAAQQATAGWSRRRGSHGSHPEGAGCPQPIWRLFFLFFSLKDIDGRTSGPLKGLCELCARTGPQNPGAPD